jgi:hypothetical protein
MSCKGNVIYLIDKLHFECIVCKNDDAIVICRFFEIRHVSKTNGMQYFCASF